jgi:choline dehydrogenase
MMKSESFHIPNAQQVSLGATSVPSVHGMHGPVSVSYPQPYLATTSFGAYITSIREFFPTLIQNLDVCTGSPNGAARFFYSIIPGTTNTPGGNRRASSAVSYIYPFLNNGKDNVVILVGHQSTSILWANTTTHTGLATAKGVRFAATPAPNADVGTTYDVTASKEVIVAAGALGVCLIFCAISFVKSYESRLRVLISWS